MKQHFIYCFSAAAIFLSGCASYNASTLSDLSSTVIQSSDVSSNNDIVAVAKTFNKADCDRYLDRDVIRKGYLPIQLYIQNNSDRSYSFSLDRVSLSCARPEEVAEKVHTSTAGRVAGYGAGALILWPLAIPAIVDGVKSAQANTALDTDFSSKTAQNQTIEPHSHLNKLIFVSASEYQDAFTVTLIDRDSKQKRVLNLLTN